MFRTRQRPGVVNRLGGRQLPNAFVRTTSGVVSVEPPPPTFTPSLNFSDARNSQYVPLVF